MFIPSADRERGIERSADGFIGTAGGVNKVFRTERSRVSIASRVALRAGTGLDLFGNQFEFISV